MIKSDKIEVEIEFKSFEVNELNEMTKELIWFVRNKRCPYKLLISKKYYGPA